MKVILLRFLGVILLTMYVCTGIWIPIIIFFGLKQEDKISDWIWVNLIDCHSNPNAQ